VLRKEAPVALGPARGRWQQSEQGAPGRWHRDSTSAGRSVGRVSERLGRRWKCWWKVSFDCKFQNGRTLQYRLASLATSELHSACVTPTSEQNVNYVFR
jgi:hypothetical protein